MKRVPKADKRERSRAGADYTGISWQKDQKLRSWHGKTGVLW
jgi:hypothetical protein